MANCNVYQCILDEDLTNVVTIRYPKRFVALGTLPMQAPELALDEMERCVKELGLCGFEIGSHINDWNLDAAELRPFWRVNSCLLL